jgi:hypothetical protein
LTGRTFKLNGKLNEWSDVLKKAFSFEELNAMQARMQAVIEAEQGKSAPPANIIDLKPVPEASEEHETTMPDRGSAGGRAAEPEGLRGSGNRSAEKC